MINTHKKTIGSIIWLTSIAYFVSQTLHSKKKGLPIHICYIISIIFNCLKPLNTKKVHDRPIRIYKVFQRVGVDYTFYPWQGEQIRILTAIDYFSRNCMECRVNNFHNCKCIAVIIVYYMSFKICVKCCTFLWDSFSSLTMLQTGNSSIAVNVQ